MGEVRPPFMELLNGHQGVIHRICRAYATDPADRQDLFQDIVYQLWRSYPQYRGDASPITWLYRVALNTALTTARRRSRRPRLVPLEMAPEPSAPQEARRVRPCTVSSAGWVASIGPSSCATWRTSATRALRKSSAFQNPTWGRG